MAPPLPTPPLTKKGWYVSDYVMANLNVFECNDHLCSGPVTERRGEFLAGIAGNKEKTYFDS
mgnify:CR=1 FL=1